MTTHRSSDPMVDHECEAVHCVACCPVYKSYGEGWEQAKSLYETPIKLHVSAPLIIAIILAVGVMAYAYNVRRNHAG